MKYAQLSPDQLSKLQELESSIGASVIALEPVAPVAELSDEALSQLKALESEQGVVLLAVQAG